MDAQARGRDGRRYEEANLRHDVLHNASDRGQSGRSSQTSRYVCVLVFVFCVVFVCMFMVFILMVCIRVQLYISMGLYVYVCLRLCLYVSVCLHVYVCGVYICCVYVYVVDVWVCVSVFLCVFFM